MKHNGSMIGLYYVIAGAYHYHFYIDHRWMENPPYLEDFELVLTPESNWGIVLIFLMVGMFFLGSHNNQHSDVVLLLTLFLWMGRLVILQPLYIELSLEGLDITMGLFTMAILIPFFQSILAEEGQQPATIGMDQSSVEKKSQ